MARKTKIENPESDKISPKTTVKSKFHLEFITPSQKLAWAAYQQNDVLFMEGSAGTGKTYLAMAFAISDVLQGHKKKIILTRPIVEAGESLGYLPGDLQEKVNPYMIPLLESLDKLVGKNEVQKDMIKKAVQIVPIAFMRGRDFSDAVCIFDEAQNSTLTQLKLFLTRFSDNSKVIITGDPNQNDLPPGCSGFVEVMSRLNNVPGIGIHKFSDKDIVRHPLVAQILRRLEK